MNHMSRYLTEFGKTGEQMVADYLKQHGFVIKAMNYRQRCGEIDVIAYKDSVVAFVEVKTRAHEYFNVSEVISVSKQRKIIKTALMYAAAQGLTEHVLRFDVALLQLQQNQYTVTYIENAFTAADT
jgi:putative endonuclease